MTMANIADDLGRVTDGIDAIRALMAAGDDGYNFELLENAMAFTVDNMERMIESVIERLQTVNN